MPPRPDLEQYFHKVLAHDRAIVHKVQEILRHLHDPGLKGPVEGILDNEIRHGSFAVLLYGILEGISQEESHAYAFIRRLMDSILARKEREKRKYVREPFLGVVRITDRKTGKEYQAKCLDISNGGVGIESESCLPESCSCQITVEFYKYAAPLHRTGKLVWMKEVLTGTFLGGIQFDVA